MREPEQKKAQELKDIATIVNVRLAVGGIGEQHQGNWWSSLWFAPNSKSFLTPIYGERTNVARYQAVTEAARRVHDERIGVGQAFHLFRLPESTERRLHDAVIYENVLDSASAIINASSAESFLADFDLISTTSTGPICVGPISELEGSKWVKSVVGHYLAAFKSGQEKLPYFAGA